MRSLFGYLLDKEFKQLFRNKILLMMIFLFPVVMIGVTPWVINFSLRHLDLAVVNQDGQSTYALQLLRKIEASDDISIVGQYRTTDPAYDDVDRNRAAVVLVIPRGFSEEMELTSHGTVQLMANAVNSTQAILAMNRMTGIIADTSAEILARQGGASLAGAAPLEIRMLDKYNPTLSYKYYMLPAILVMVLTMLCGIYPAISLASEKEVGTITQINSSPLNSATYITAKVFPFWIIGIAITLLGALLIWLIYGLAPRGNFFLILFACLVFSVVISFNGIIIANVAKTVQQAMFIELFSVMVLFIISGLFTPINTMPWWGKVIAYINPLTYLNSIMRMIYLKGSTLADLWPYFVILVGIGVVTGALAVVTHHKRS
jgi:ABC-2 type transport system permease protein